MRTKLMLLATFTSIAAMGSVSMTTAQDKAAPPAITQGATNFKRTPLQKFDVPGSNMETVVAIAEIIPNVDFCRHTHPGVESAYLLEGDLVLKLDGQPDKAMKPGDSWQVPVGVIHDVKTGAKGAKLLVTHVVEKGKPLASPAK